MRIFKFGGSSLASASLIKDVVQIVKSSAASSENACLGVVLSACGGVTDELLAIVKKAAKKDLSYEQDLSDLSRRHTELVRKLVDEKKQRQACEYLDSLSEELKNLIKGVLLLQEISPRTLDEVLAFGERYSAFIVCEALKSAGVQAFFVDARELLLTDAAFGKAKVQLNKSYENIVAHRKKNDHVMVITGFIARSEDGHTTTLGRGGSDLSAALFGAALGVDEIEIWTDVDGVMTADPRKVSNALTISNMTYEEAMEMSHFGAKVIYPPTMMPALEKQIPIRIRNTLNPKSPGTRIEAKSSPSSHMVRGISSIDRVSLMNVQGGGMIGITGISERLFKALAREKINVILISQASSEHSICVALAPEVAKRAEQAVNAEFALEIEVGHIEKVVCDHDFCVVAVVGENMRLVPGISGHVFSTLGKNGINVSAISQGSSERNISLVVQSSDAKKAVKCLHDAFFLSGTRSVNVYLVGVGLIGRCLLKQLMAQREILKEEHYLELRLHGVTNTKKMLVSEEAVELDSWERRLSDDSMSTNLEDFVDQMIEANRPNSVFVDCTSSDTIIEQYDRILKSSISIVTPNKKANSSDFERFERLSKLAKQHDAKFLYEANVGAGLPVLSSIRNLRLSGDKIIKIEAILSGTLSHLFNELSSEKPFSKMVREVKERGYTEPDPREDLDGMDVARKLLILGREMGLPMQLDDIKVEPFLAQSDSDPDSVEEWFKTLPEHDAHFESLRKRAEEKGKALRFVATIENNKGSAGLIEVGQDHPCFSVSGSDNVVSVTTERYFERPLVIKGPGAGAEVTAAQVFADIIRVSNHLN